MELKIHDYRSGLYYIGFELYNSTDEQLDKFISLALDSKLGKKLNGFWHKGTGRYYRSKNKNKLHDWNYVEYLGLSDPKNKDFQELYLELKKALLIEI